VAHRNLHRRVGHRAAAAGGVENSPVSAPLGVIRKTLRVSAPPTSEDQLGPDEPGGVGDLLRSRHGQSGTALIHSLPRLLMPEISRFFGIVIAMFYDDHRPPHFHVRYGEQRALIAIETLGVLRGRLSPRALALVAEWAARHQAELMENWALARSYAPLRAIDPLE
jgi:hypothetical protein